MFSSTQTDISCSCSVYIAALKSMHIHCECSGSSLHNSRANLIACIHVSCLCLISNTPVSHLLHLNHWSCSRALVGCQVFGEQPRLQAMSLQHKRQDTLPRCKGMVHSLNRTKQCMCQFARKTASVCLRLIFANGSQPSWPCTAVKSIFLQ